MKYQFITCSNCGAGLTVPKNAKRTAVVCPYCAHELGYGKEKVTFGEILYYLFVPALALIFIPCFFVWLCWLPIRGIGRFIGRLLGIKGRTDESHTDTNHASYEDTGSQFQSGPEQFNKIADNQESQSADYDATFNVIKNYGGGYIGRYFQAVAVMNNAGHTCTEISVYKYQKDFIESICLTATLRGMGKELASLSMFIFDQNQKIEQELNRKMGGTGGEVVYDEITRANEEARIGRKGLQDFAEEQFFEALLGQANTASNRKLIGFPFDRVVSSYGKEIVNNNWSIATKEGEEDVSYIAYFEINEGEPESRGYKSELVVYALKRLAAQYGLNMPIREEPL